MISLFKIKHWIRKTFYKPPFIEFKPGDILVTKNFLDLGCYLGKDSYSHYIAGIPYDYMGMPYYGGTHIPEAMALWFKIGHIDIPDIDEMSEKYRVWQDFVKNKSKEDIVNYFNTR
jgi:hypothetical protein